VNTRATCESLPASHPISVYAARRGHLSGDTAPGVIPGVVPGVIERAPARGDDKGDATTASNQYWLDEPCGAIATSTRVDDPPSVSGYAGRVVAAACRNPESLHSLFRLVNYP